MSKDYPECCAKLVKMEKKLRRVDHFVASEVKINKFRARERAVPTQDKKTQQNPIKKIANENPSELSSEEN